VIILILDDEQIRHDLTEKYLGKENIILHAFNADEAIAILKASQQRIGLALLDHDLHEFVADETGHKWEKHGGYFVRTMIDMVREENWPAQIVIHSYNSGGAQGMKTTLKAKGVYARYMPFSGEMLRAIVEELKLN
jgi:CheY-like chemotaxis protein